MTEYFSDGGGWEQQAGYSRAVRRGNTIEVSGTTAHGDDGAAMHVGDTYRQATECLVRVLNAVDRLGGCVDDIVCTVVYLTPEASWQDAARAHREVFDAVRPANTTVIVHGLVGTGFLVEIQARAVLA